MMDSPCKGCGKRSVAPNCHGYCQEYRDWRAALWAEKDAAQAGREADAFRWEARDRYFKRMNGNERVGQV